MLLSATSFIRFRSEKGWADPEQQNIMVSKGRDLGGRKERDGKRGNRIRYGRRWGRYTKG